jgi:hypothetical protein
MKIFFFGLLLLVLLSAITGRLSNSDKRWFKDLLKKVGKKALEVGQGLAQKGLQMGVGYLQNKLGERRFKK